MSNNYHRFKSRKAKTINNLKVYNDEKFSKVHNSKMSFNKYKPLSIDQQKDTMGNETPVSAITRNVTDVAHIISRALAQPSGITTDIVYIEHYKTRVPIVVLVVRVMTEEI